jgi:hypothetical protein
MNDQISEQDKEAKFKELFERARKGVLKHLDEKGGSLPMSDMHEYSLNTYFIQHQRFSQMMETFVGEELIDYDPATQISTITDKGREFIK